jgi:hypothetical protein
MNAFFAAIALAAVIFACGLGEKGTTSSGDGQEPRTVKATPAKTPIDRDAVRTELLSIANDLTEAARDGDITTIAQRTTDDFELTDVQGKVQNKNKALADIKEERTVRSWAITDPQLLSASDDSAVLQYVLNVTLKSGASGRARVTDSFVNQNGKWMLRSEQQTMIR